MTEFANLCRICLLPESPKTGNMFPLLSAKIHMNSIALLDAIGLFTDMYLTTEDTRFPQRICCNCVSDLTRGYTFKLKCEQSEVYLRKKILRHNFLSIERKQDKATSTKDLKHCCKPDSSDIEPVLPSKRRKIESTDTFPEEITKIEECDYYELASDSAATINGNQVKLEQLFLGNISENICETDQRKNTINSEPGQYSATLNTGDELKPVLGAVIIKNEKIVDGNVVVNLPNFETYPTSYKSEYDSGDLQQNNMTAIGGNNDAGELLNFDDIIEYSDYEIIKSEKISPTQAHRVEESLEDDWSQEAQDAESMFLANIKQKRSESTEKESSSIKNESPGAVSNIKSEKVYECEKCLKKFVSDHYLMLHSILKHSQCACPTCGEELNNEADYEEHVSKHTSEELKMSDAEIISYDFRAKRYCQHCNEFFNNVSELRNHYRSRHINGNYCDICKKDIETNQFKHVSFHTNPEKHRCELCSLSFLREHMLKVHMTTIHNDYSICEFCLKEFDTEEDFKSHKFEHEMNGTYGCYICPKCEKVCVSVLGLTKHYDTHLEPAYSCDKCCHTFHTLSDYKKHLALDHQLKCAPTCHYCKIVN